MLDERSEALMQTILDRENCSLLQYVRDAFPWTSALKTAGVADLQRIIQEEARLLGEITRWCLRHHLPAPLAGRYLSSFTSINFIGLDYLKGQLLKAQKQSISQLQHDLEGVTNSEVRTLLTRLLELKQRHLHELETLGSRPLVAAAAAH